MKNILNFNNLINLCNLCCLCFILSKCATIVPPSGGPKDITPPEVEKSIPENYSTQFSANVIKITFNKYIQLNDLYNQLIISPPIEPIPDFKIKGKTLIIKLDVEFMGNTTYSFNFGDAICDINENNPIENFQYVFSTGEFLDSLSISGKAMNAFDMKAEKGILVMLYDCDRRDAISHQTGDGNRDSIENKCDSLPYVKLPDYFTKTGSSGKFKINNIKNGKYKVFALMDENRNYLYDLPNERIAFLDRVIDPADTRTIAPDTGVSRFKTVPRIAEIQLSLFEEKKTKQRLIKAYAGQYGKITLIFKEPADNVRIRPLNFSSKKPWEIADFSKNKDTLHYWFTMGIDTLVLEVNDYEPGITGQPVFSDTVEIPVEKEKDKIKLSIKTNLPAPGKIRPGKQKGITNVLFDLYENIQVVFSHPVTAYDFSKVIITERIDTMRKDTIKYEVIFDDKAMRRFELKYPWKPDSVYQLYIPQGCFKDIFNLTNDSLCVDFKIRSLSYYGSIKVKLDMSERLPGEMQSSLYGTKKDSTIEHNYIVQLLDEKENIVGEKIISYTGSVKQVIWYEYLKPNNYKLKMIYDINNNSKWDTGNYLQKLQPEKVIYYPGTITVRSNWDIEVEWKME
ncbi:MAG: Ig-like domain-containing protein [Bacteroidota bacterium]